MADDTTTLPRETGAEKAPDQVCPECGGPVPTIEAPYGGLSGGACPKCYPAAQPQRQEASQSTPPRELGTPSAPSAPDYSGGAPDA